MKSDPKMQRWEAEDKELAIECKGLAVCLTVYCSGLPLVG
jgi:hypothetical protein